MIELHTGDSQKYIHIISSCSGVSTSISSSSSCCAVELLQFNPWQFPHAGMQGTPYFLHVHLLFSQDSSVVWIWHLHVMNFRIDSGAMGSRDPTGSNASVYAQPYSIGSNDWLSKRSQSRYWRYALRACWTAAPVVGGSLSGLNVPFVTS